MTMPPPFFDVFRFSAFDYFRHAACYFFHLLPRCFRLRDQRYIFHDLMLRAIFFADFAAATRAGAARAAICRDAAVVYFRRYAARYGILFSPLFFFFSPAYYFRCRFSFAAILMAADFAADYCAACVIDTPPCRFR